MAFSRTGGCQCGGVRYALAEASPDAPWAVYVCHCTECRKQSASAFGISVIVPPDSFRLTAGAPRVWTRQTATGNRLDCWFCPDCGGRIWHASSGFAEIRSVKGGTLDDPPDLGSAIHIWTASKVPGIVVPQGAQSFPGEPD
jgi:hypothetical protein